MFKVGDRVEILECELTKQFPGLYLSKKGVITRISSQGKNGIAGDIKLDNGKDIINWGVSIKKEEQMVDAKSRGLFAIRAVNKETDEVAYSSEIVAESENEALFNSDLKEALKTKELKKDDVHIIVTEIGKLPPKEDIKKVKVLGGIGSVNLVKEIK